MTLETCRRSSHRKGICSSGQSSDLFGAQGEAVAGGSILGAGGHGGETTASLAVQPGQVLEVVVGGSGANGGFNGGGAGGANTIEHIRGGNGGGASDVRVGSCAAAKACDYAARVLVAGGGGGAGVDMEPYEEYAFDGGAGGGASGVAGSDGVFLGVHYPGSGGGAGTQMAGGDAGTNCAPTLPGQTAGVFGVGGHGASAESEALGPGGGGGGWFGGGGGGCDAGGGGGSGYITPLSSDDAFQTGVRSGDGMVLITKG